MTGASASTVRVLLFARLRREAGWTESTMDIQPGSTVSELVLRLGRSTPMLDLRGCMCAIDERYAAPDETLHGGETVAFLPPVSGG